MSSSLDSNVTSTTCLQPVQLCGGQLYLPTTALHGASRLDSVLAACDRSPFFHFRCKFRAWSTTVGMSIKVISVGGQPGGGGGGLQEGYQLI